MDSFGILKKSSSEQKTAQIKHKNTTINLRNRCSIY